MYFGCYILIKDACPRCEVVWFRAIPRLPCAVFAALRHLVLMVLHFLVKGRVQGVGFRWFVHREAAELNLRGWVRNTTDGHVEIVASGNSNELDGLKAALRKGSRGSRVDRIEEHELQESEAANLGPFEIEGAW
jgi:acylphosphatase